MTLFERPDISSGCTDCVMELLSGCAEPQMRLLRAHPVVVPKGTIPSNTCCKSICVPWASGADDCAVEQVHERPRWTASPSTIHPESGSSPLLEVDAEMQTAAKSSRPTRDNRLTARNNVGRQSRRVGCHWEHRTAQHVELW